MRYSREPMYRKYVKDTVFLSFVRRFGDKYGKKFMDTVTKTGIDTVIQKTAEATGDLVGNKIADETTSLGKTKSKEKKR